MTPEQEVKELRLEIARLNRLLDAERSEYGKILDQLREDNQTTLKIVGYLQSEIDKSVHLVKKMDQEILK